MEAFVSKASSLDNFQVSYRNNLWIELTFVELLEG